VQATPLELPADVALLSLAELSEIYSGFLRVRQSIWWRASQESNLGVTVGICGNPGHWSLGVVRGFL